MHRKGVKEIDDKNSVSETLTAEHRWLDARFETFQAQLALGQVSGDTFQEAAQVLHRHIYLEEEVLFPELEACGLTGPTAVMAQEHGRICRALGKIQNLIGENAAPAKIQAIFRGLLALLEEHDFKEEHVLYPSADQLLAQANLKEVLRQLHEANPPADWACRAHRT